LKYKVPFNVGDLEEGYIIKVNASLSNGATWGFDVDPIEQVGFCSSSAVTDCSVGGGDSWPVTISKASSVGDKNLSAVEFAIQVQVGSGGIAAASATASAYLYFCPSVDASFLETEDSTLSLTMDVSIQQTLGAPVPVSSATIPIAVSKAGLSVLIDAAQTPSAAAISFAADSLKFATGSATNNMTDTNTVNLGTVYVKGLEGVKDRDGVNAYKESFSSWGGKLTITDGPFSASTGANQVFLSKTEDCVFDSTTSIPANTVDSKVAEWTALDQEDLTALNTDPGLYVCVVADGTTTIEEQPRAPSAVLQMGPGTALMKYPPGRLRHLKENGTKCTLFNIPDGTEALSPMISTDVVSIRITNNGPDQGNLYATLYNQKGEPIYTPKRQAIGTIGPFQTVRYYTGQESAINPPYDPAFDLATYGNAQHWVGQRATLIIATELPDVSIFDLVRNRNSAPNMNMSTGATGNGCD
jgi:hypothetical protein